MKRQFSENSKFILHVIFGKLIYQLEQILASSKEMLRGKYKLIKVKILGISGSPRHGNTEILVKEALKAGEELSGVETELISLATAKIDGGCKADYACWKKSTRELFPYQCVTYKDDVNKIMAKMIESDGIIIGTPVYWGSIPSQLKALFDRSMPVEIDFVLRNKVGGAIAVAAERHGGHEGSIADIHKWFLIHDMIICGVGPERPKTTLGGHYGAMALQGFPNPVHSNVPGKRPLFCKTT